MVCQLHQLRLDIVPCFTGSGAADHDHVLVARIFPVLRPAVHGQGFRRCQDNVVIRDWINIGSDILWSPPSGGSVFYALPVLLCVFAAILDDHIDWDF